MKKSDKINKIFYTYVHVRLDTNKVFYVGKGKLRRAYSKQHRNKYWNNVVNKCGYKVIFVKKNIHIHTYNIHHVYIYIAIT